MKVIMVRNYWKDSSADHVSTGDLHNCQTTKKNTSELVLSEKLSKLYQTSDTKFQDQQHHAIYRSGKDYKLSYASNLGHVNVENGPHSTSFQSLTSFPNLRVIHARQPT